MDEQDIQDNAMLQEEDDEVQMDIEERDEIR